MEVPDSNDAAPVSLVIPAEAGYFQMVRSLVTSVASMLEITVDTIEDQRLAVSEACNLLIASIPDAKTLRVEIWPTPERLSVAVSAESTGTIEEAPEFSWVIISQLAPGTTRAELVGRDVITLSWPTLSSQA